MSSLSDLLALLSNIPTEAPAIPEGLPTIPENPYTTHFTRKVLRNKLSPDASSNPPNMERLYAWAESQNTPMLRQIAHKMVTHLNYISFDKFLTQLRTTVADFHEKTNDEPYVLVIAENDFDKLFREGCSDTWVAGLALKHANLRKPEEILSLGDCHNYLLTHPEVKNVLILDDAAYSGRQKERAMTHFFEQSKLYRLDKLKVYMGLAYQSNAAEKKIKATDPSASMVMLNHGDIPSMMDAFNPREKEYINALKLMLDGFDEGLMSMEMDKLGLKAVHEGLTLTYFDHRYPDFMSTYEPLYTGANLLASPRHVARLRESLGDSAYTMSTQALVPNREKCKGYTIPEIKPPYDRRPKRMNWAGERRGYDRTCMTDEQQNAFDLRYVNADAFLRIPTKKETLPGIEYLTKGGMFPSRVERNCESFEFQNLCDTFVPSGTEISVG